MSNIINLVKLSFNNLLAVKNIPIFVIIGFGIASMVNPSFSVLLIGMITYVTAYQTMAYEDTYNINSLMSYLPVTKKQYVISRYVFSILTLVFACIVFSITYYISYKFNLMGYRLLDYKTNLYIGIVMSVVLISVLIPVLLYFGIKKGRMAMILVFIGFVMIPSMSLVDSEVTINILNKISNMNINLVLSIFALIILGISYVIANKLYYKKEIVE